jgi:ABC-type branched-subunit amino acid transport system substrate-binding protein
VSGGGLRTLGQRAWCIERSFGGQAAKLGGSNRTCSYGLGAVSTLRAAATLGITGRYAVQAGQSRAGLQLWAEHDDIDLRIHDDLGSAAQAVDLYRHLLREDVDILLGPYSSGLVRRVAPVVCGAERLLWNHGGSADDVARPALVTVPAPASSYLRPLVQGGRDRGATGVVLLQGTGRFGEQVIDGAAQEATAAGLRVEAAAIRSWRVPASLAQDAVLIAGTFDEDVDTVEGLRTAGVEVALLGCVAAGIHHFGTLLGPLADGVVGPAQWVSRDDPAEIGPTGAAFARRFQDRFGRPADYPAAQAAATGWLAAEATRRGWDAEDVRRWRTTTLLGEFALDASWRQVGHAPVPVTWRGGRLGPL